MDKALLKRTAFQSVALMLAVITISFALRQYQAVTISASNTTASEASLSSEDTLTTSETGSGNLQNSLPGGLQTASDNKPEENITKLADPEIMQLMEGVNPDILKQMGQRYLVIKKPLGTNISYQLEDIYITKSIKLTLSGLNGEDMNSLMIGRSYGDEAFRGNPLYTETVIPDTNPADDEDDSEIIRDYGDDIVHNIAITNSYDDKAKNYKSELMIELDSVYVQLVTEDDNYYYINLKKPKEVYDKILVIDAGHGGKDAGALSQGEKYYEKNINLAILLDLKELLDKENIKVYYTRTGDDKVFLRPRVDLANAVDCDFFVSIHCNANEVTWPNGTEVLYYDTEFKGVKNKEMANLFLNEVDKATTLEKREIVKKQGDEIFILKKAIVPAVLIEVGYLTNNKDMNYLSKEKNRKTVAQGIYNGIMKAYDTYTLTNDGL